jgi:hypothetical protein
MTTKTLSSLIIAGVLATSAAAAVQVIDPTTLVSGPVSLASSTSAEPAASNEALLLLRVSSTPANLKQRPAGIVRITR